MIRIAITPAAYAASRAGARNGPLLSLSAQASLLYE
jgi:hypothetical protein